MLFMHVFRFAFPETCATTESELETETETESVIDKCVMYSHFTNNYMRSYSIHFELNF